MFNRRNKMKRISVIHLIYTFYFTESPSVPMIYDSEMSILNGETAPYDEGSGLTLICEVSGGMCQFFPIQTGIFLLKFSL